MKIRELKDIIKSCLFEFQIYERGKGDPNSIDAHGPKLSKLKSSQPQKIKITRNSDGESYLDLYRRWKMFDSQEKKLRTAFNNNKKYKHLNKNLHK